MLRYGVMRKRDRVRGRFNKILGNRIYSKGGLTIFGIPGKGKVGVAVYKNVKGAVKRNRVKRHLREFARKNVLHKTSYDVILIAGDKDFSKGPITLPK